MSINHPQYSKKSQRQEVSSYLFFSLPYKVGIMGQLFSSSDLPDRYLISQMSQSCFSKADYMLRGVNFPCSHQFMIEFYREANQQASALDRKTTTELNLFIAGVSKLFSSIARG